MTASPKTIDKEKLLAKSKAALKRTGDLVKAFPMPAQKSPADSPAADGQAIAINVKPVPGETSGVTAMKKISQDKLMSALALRDLVYRSEAITVQDACQVLKEQGERAAAGDLSHLQSTLAVQAIALDAIFADFVRRSAIAKTYDEMERLLRIALKAQGQSRTSIESLAVIQQGPKIFARQANVSHGGQQQVNNHASAVVPASHAHAHAEQEKPAEQTIPRVAP